MKYVAFDIGNVICHANMNPFIEEISTTFNISLAEAARFLRSFQQIHDLGLTTMENQLRVWFDCKSEVVSQRLIEHWNDSIKPNQKVIDSINNMIDKGTKVALLSNIGVEHAEMMKTKLPGVYHRSVRHFSCFVGARKPSMVYYQSFLMQNPEFKGCLYVDDLVENLEASKQFGFKPYNFDLENPQLSYKFIEIEWEMAKKDNET